MIADLPGVDVGVATMSEDYTAIASHKPLSALAGSLEAPAMGKHTSNPPLLVIFSSLC